MSLLKNIRGIFNTKVMGEEIVDTQVRMYQQFKQSNPHLEEHELLANVWRSRRKALELSISQKTDDETLNQLAFTETHLFSVLDYPNSIRALGLYIVYKERPDIIGKHPEFQAELDRLLKPVFRAQDDGAFLKWYQRKNPKLVARVAGTDPPNLPGKSGLSEPAAEKAAETAETLDKERLKELAVKTLERLIGRERAELLQAVPPTTSSGAQFCVEVQKEKTKFMDQVQRSRPEILRDDTTRTALIHNAFLLLDRGRSADEVFSLVFDPGRAAPRTWEEVVGIITRENDTANPGGG